MYATLAYPKSDAPLVDPRPSSSILVFNPQNELLLLHRVRTSSAFPSAHVFPGGTLSEFHEGVPPLGSAARHIDGHAYRLAAVRETFEESGILLARPRGDATGPLLHLSPDAVAAGRKAIHGDQVRFSDWLAELGAEPDLDNLIPFTRWITPPHLGKRFSAQMYLYFLPESEHAALASHDGGIEHTEAQWASAAEWVERARNGSVIMYEPQAYLVHVAAAVFAGAPAGDYAAQRAALERFAASPPRGPDGPSHSATATIPWCDKVMCPYVAESDDTGRAVLAIESPGPELEGTGRGGDYERVVIVRSWDSRPREVDVCWRRDVLSVPPPPRM